MQVLRRWLPLLAVVALLTAAGAAASMTQLPLTQADLPKLNPAGEMEQRDRFVGPPQPTPETTVFPRWVLLALIVIAVIVAIVLLSVVFGARVRRGRRFGSRPLRMRAPAKPGAGVGDQLVAALDAGLQQLDESDADPRRAVIACWVRLEKAAAAAGTPRLAGDTPTDLVLRLLGGHSLSEGVLTGLAAVYLQARYASHRVDEGMREQAKTALGRLREELVGVSAA